MKKFIHLSLCCLLTSMSSAHAPATVHHETSATGMREAKINRILACIGRVVEGLVKIIKDPHNKPAVLLNVGEMLSSVFDATAHALPQQAHGQAKLTTEQELEFRQLVSDITAAVEPMLRQYMCVQARSLQDYLSSTSLQELEQLIARGQAQIDQELATLPIEDDITQELHAGVIHMLHALVHDLFAIVQNPENPQLIGQSIADMLASIMNIASQTLKYEYLSSEEAEEHVALYLDSFSNELTKEIKHLMIQTALHLRGGSCCSSKSCNSCCKNSCSNSCGSCSSSAVCRPCCRPCGSCCRTINIEQDNEAEVTRSCSSCKACDCKPKCSTSCNTCKQSCCKRTVDTEVTRSCSCKACSCKPKCSTSCNTCKQSCCNRTVDTEVTRSCSSCKACDCKPKCSTSCNSCKQSCCKRSAELEAEETSSEAIKCGCNRPKPKREQEVSTEAVETQVVKCGCNKPKPKPNAQTQVQAQDQTSVRGCCKTCGKTSGCGCSGCNRSPEMQATEVDAQTVKCACSRPKPKREPALTTDEVDTQAVKCGCNKPKPKPNTQAQSSVRGCCKTCGKTSGCGCSGCNRSPELQATEVDAQAVKCGCNRPKPKREPALTTDKVDTQVVKCGCNKPKPKPIERVTITDAGLSESADQIDTQSVKCGCNRPKPKREQAVGVTEVNNSQVVKCGCNRPKPKPNTQAITSVSRRVLYPEHYMIVNK